MDNRLEVSQKFNAVAQQYDQQRKMLIPCFDDFYSIASSLTSSTKKTPRILDLGAGTGLFSSLVLKKFPEAHMTLIDLSEQMLDIAKERFADEKHITYICDDYTNYLFDAPFDVIISSLSIHHLTNEKKYKLYEHIYRCLNPGGMFINADQVLGETDELDTLYKEDWLAKVKSSSLTEDEIEAAIERTKLDKMATLSAQLDWLKEIGFSEVDCVYKYYNFVVFTGRK